MNLTVPMLRWLESVSAGKVRRPTDIPAGTRRALERRHLLVRDPDTLRPVATERGHLVVDGAAAERRYWGAR